MTAYWTIPHDGGVTAINLDTNESMLISVWQLPQDAGEALLDCIDGRGDELRVVHFPLSADVGVAHVVDRFVSNRFHDAAGIIAVSHSHRPKREIERVLQAANSASVLSDLCLVHRVPRRLGQPSQQQEVAYANP